jgi:hypothetical protein
VNSENNAHELRIVLYHFSDSQTVEYRISAMERVILFKDEQALFTQLMKRLRLVYGDINNCAGQPYARVFLPLPELGIGKDIDSILNVHEYDVDGDDEYEICSVTDFDAFNDDDTKDGSVEVDSEDTLLFNKKIFLLKERELIDLMKEHKYILTDSEKQEWGEKRLSFDEAGLDCYYENGRLTSINFGVIDELNNFEFLPN